MSEPTTTAELDRWALSLLVDLVDEQHCQFQRWTLRAINHPEQADEWTTPLEERKAVTERCRQLRRELARLLDEMDEKVAL